MIDSTNPYNGEFLKSYKEMSEKEINMILDTGIATFKEWKQTTFSHRSRLLKNAAEELLKNKMEYTVTITREMGKPISQSLSEIEKCSWVCEYYSENAAKQLTPLEINTGAHQSLVNYEPLGLVLAVMPWNFPFWQVFRFAAPAIMAGNISILKHASNVMGSAINIEKVFIRSGFPKGCFQNLIIGSKKVEKVVRDPRINAVTLTGSTAAGSAVASVAGEVIKKSVLELGGSNALVVFDDANITEAVKTCIQARFQNTGQSCIAGKRLLLQESIAETFLKKFEKQVRDLISGDPMDERTYIGVLASEELAVILEKQVNLSIEQGAELLLGGKREGAYFEPTILTGVTEKMPVFCEETFGPVMAVTVFSSEEEAVDLVNSSPFGLGVSVFTENLEKARRLVPLFGDGAVFVNDLVKSDPRLPFGGTKASGYGRELSEQGIKEFVNIKTVVFNKY